MRQRIPKTLTIDDIPSVRRGRFYVTRATEALLRNIDKACHAKDRERQARAVARRLRGKA